jgi:hypothetical protein
MQTHSPNKPKQFEQTSDCQNADGNCFLGHDRNADRGSHATWYHNNIRSVLQNTPKKKQLCMASENKRHGMLITGVVLLHDNACPHTVTRT